MNIKIVVGIFIALVAGGFLCGCVDDTPSTSVDGNTYVDTTVIAEVIDVVTPDVYDVTILTIKYDQIGRVDGLFEAQELVKQAIDITLRGSFIIYRNGQLIDTGEWDNTIIPSDYYDKPSVIPPDETLIEFLTMYNWGAGSQYEVNAFDCSQMTAHMEWVLENAGYKAKIIEGDSSGDGNLDHAWLSIYLRAGTVMYEDMIIEEHWYGDDTADIIAPSSGYYWYECTGRYFYIEGNDMPTAMYQYDSIQDVEDAYSKYVPENFEREYGWWNK